jgi:hypothetical protein
MTSHFEDPQQRRCCGLSCELGAKAISRASTWTEFSLRSGTRRRLAQFEYHRGCSLDSGPAVAVTAGTRLAARDQHAVFPPPEPFEAGVSGSRVATRFADDDRWRG